MIRKISFSFLLMMLMLFFSLNSVYAVQADPLKITNMDIKILPEYGTSDVLVMYTIRFINISGMPYDEEIRVHVPKGTFNNIVKETINPLDTPLAVRLSDKGEYDELVWKPKKPIQPNVLYDIHLKYYYNPLPGTGYKKFHYELHANTTVDEAKIYVYQPLKASDFMMEPQGQAYGINKEGFQIFGLTASSLKKGEMINLSISYMKNDPSPSIQYQSAATKNVQAPGLSQGNFILIIAGVMLTAVVVMVIRTFSRIPESISGTVKRDRSLTVFSQEKRKLRQMLLNDEIDEETYHYMLHELEKRT